MNEGAARFERMRQLCSIALCGETLGKSAVSNASATESDLALAERHRVVSLSATGLSASSAVSSDFLHRRVLALAQQTVRLEQELGVMASCLSAAGVDFLLLKGPALARQAYPVPEWRVYDDLDLWVESRDLDLALRALEAVGYQPSQPLNSRAAACAHRAGIEVALVHPARGRLIEVSHGRRSLAPSPLAAREILESAVSLDIAGTGVRTPAPYHALLLACVHGAHHRWDRLSWVADIAGLWQRLSSSEQVKACATARRWRMETRLGLGLHLASTLFNLSLEAPPEALVGSPAVQALAARVKLEAIAADSSRVPILDRLRFEHDALDSARQRWRMKREWLFTPTLGDIEAVSFPASLYFFYALIRPLRLLRYQHRAWRTLAGHSSWL